MKKILTVAVLALSLLIPAFSFANTHTDDFDTDTIQNECVDLKVNMRRGSSDARTNGEVSVLQNFLKDEGYLSGSTGYFGTKTRTAVRRFQSEEGIGSTGTPGYGNVGGRTRAAIKAMTCGGATTTATSTPVVTITPNPVVQSVAYSLSATSTGAGFFTLEYKKNADVDYYNQGCFSLTAGSRLLSGFLATQESVRPLAVGLNQYRVTAYITNADCIARVNPSTPTVVPFTITATSTIPVAPVIISGAITAVRASATPSTISWLPVSGATEYKYRLNSGTAVAALTRADIVVNGNATVSWQGYLGTMFLVGSHNFAVQACNSAGCSAFGNPLVVVVVNQPTATSTIPVLTIAPNPVVQSALYSIDLTITNAGFFTLEYKKNTDVNYYNFNYDNQGCFRMPAGTHNTNNFLATQEPTPPLAVGLNQYRVTAYITNADCIARVNPSTPTVVPFTITATSTIPVAPVIISGAITAVRASATPSTISWLPVSGATEYKYRLNSGTAVAALTRADIVVNGNATVSWQGYLGTMFLVGSHNFAVQACNSAGCSAFGSPLVVVVVEATPTASMTVNGLSSATLIAGTDPRTWRWSSTYGVSHSSVAVVTECVDTTLNGTSAWVANTASGTDGPTSVTVGRKGCRVAMTYTVVGALPGALGNVVTSTAILKWN